MNFRGIIFYGDWVAWAPFFIEESLSLNDNISLTQLCYIQNFLAEAFV